jgi:hypothetical protein
MSESAPLAHVQVVRGTPDEVELAALVAGIVAAVSEGAAEAEHADAATAGRPQRRHLAPRPGLLALVAALTSAPGLARRGPGNP